MEKLYAIKPVYLILALSGLLIASLVVATAALASLGLFGPVFSSAPTPFSIPTPGPSTTESALMSSIGGMVWHDVCAGGSEGEPDPSSPPPGCVWVESQAAFAADAVLQSGEPGIGGVLVELGPGACPSLGLATAFTANDGSYAFDGLTPGTYCISADPALAGNPSLLTPGRWTAPERVTGRIQVSVAVGLAENHLDVDLGWDYEFLPAPEPTPEATSTPTPELTQCTDRASFVTDVTVPDDTNLKGGTPFQKIWRVVNAGTCSWDGSYALVFAGGERMGVASPANLHGSVAPGATVDISLDLVAPSANGSYRGNWLLSNTAGGLFGIGAQGDQPIWVQIVVGATPTPAPAPWKAEFYDNRDLDGDPDLVRRDTKIDFNWRDGAPANRISENNFSVRWTGKFNFNFGTYRFTVLVDDGARLWVDDQLVIDEWEDGGERELKSDVGLTKGTHDVRLEYYDHNREARVRLTWDKVSSPDYPEWKAEFWSNRDMDGDPILVRNDHEIDFNWGSEAPAAGVPGDNFSVRWRRKVTFDEGTYHFRARSDDGVRVYVDDKRVINEWHDSGGDTYTVDLNLSGSRRITVEYYERSGKALVHFWWERLSPTPTATPTLTVTPTATTVPASATPTQTQTQEPTATPTATVGPQTMVVFDFVERSCEATWRNGDEALACPGGQGDSAGYVLRLGEPAMENGSQSGGAALLTSPQLIAAGRIEGTFPLLNVQSGDRFRATLGCLEDQTECNVTLQFSYLTEDNELKPKTLGRWSETYDGQLTVVDLDLGSLAGKTVSFILTVRGSQASSQNIAVWLAPAVWR